MKKNKRLNNYTILKNIQIIRLKLDLTQDEVADQLNITTKHLSEIERGISNPSFDLLLNLFNFYNNENGTLLNLNKIFYNDHFIE